MVFKTHLLAFPFSIMPGRFFLLAVLAFLDEPWVAMAARLSTELEEESNSSIEDAAGDTLEEADNSTVQDVARDVLFCMEPDLVVEEGTAAQILAEKLEELQASRAIPKELKVDGWANRPFATYKISKRFPAHMMLGIVSSDDKFKAGGPPVDRDSFCFEFDYSNSNPEEPDPAWCAPFSKTFKPLKELRNCIVDRLEADSFWTERRGGSWESAKKKNYSDLRNADLSSYDAWCDSAVYDPRAFPPASICQKTMDTKRRAQEMIKFSLFPKTLEALDVPDYLTRKIHTSTAYPGMKDRNQHTVNPETATRISTDCFNVTAGDQEQAHFVRLQKIGKCLPLMFDKAEVSDGFGISDGFLKFFDPSVWGPPVNFRKHHTYDVPPVCGRMALGSLQKLQTTPYEVIHTGSILAIVGTLWKQDKGMRFSTCREPPSINCRKAYFCWEKALNLMCAYSSLCCPGNDAAAREKRQKTCAQHPKARCAGMIAQ